MSSSGTIAYLERKKQPFLKALLRYGKVAPATRSVRISRDAVYDWLHSDPVFRRAFNQAKRERFDYQTAELSKALDLLLGIVKSIIPSDIYPRIVASTNLVLSQRQFKADSQPPRVASRKRTRFPSFDVLPDSAKSGNDGSRGLGYQMEGI